MSQTLHAPVLEILFSVKAPFASGFLPISRYMEDFGEEKL